MDKKISIVGVNVNYTRNEQAVDKKKTEKALAVLALFFALIIAALGLFEMNEYMSLNNLCYLLKGLSPIL